MTICIENVDDLSEPCLSAFMRGVKASEERIIKLLEERKATNEPEIAQWVEAALHRYQELETTIALIKGKTK